MTNEVSIVDREFSFTQNDFDHIKRLMYDHSGINLTEKKRDMVYARLARHLRRLRLTAFRDYLQVVENDPAEYLNLVNSLTTNLTHFFREKHHFDYIQQKLLPDYAKRKLERIRFWSAGCSTGEEPYTLAMVWDSSKNKPQQADFKILATDIDTNVLATGNNGRYAGDRLNPVSKEYMKYFKPGSHNSFEVSDKLKALVFFKQLNLMNSWPMNGPFQLIVCRNVLIYFDKKTQERVVSRMIDLLEPQGALMLGHSENLSVCKERLQSVGKTIFRKVGGIT